MGLLDRVPSQLLFSQSYRQGNYQKAFDLYNQLLDSAEPVCPTALYLLQLH